MILWLYRFAGEGLFNVEVFHANPQQVVIIPTLSVFHELLPLLWSPLCLFSSTSAGSENSKGIAAASQKLNLGFCLLDTKLFGDTEDAAAEPDCLSGDSPASIVLATGMGRRSREKRERQQQRADQHQAWTAFEPATIDGKDQVTVAGETFSAFKNSRCTVLVRRVSCGPNWLAMVQLSIRRNDRKPIHDWRDLQRIKNEIVGRENEGVELYPAESRLLDSANQFHMFVLEDLKLRFPFGYRERLVSENSVGGAVQRPWKPEDRPADLRAVTEAEMRVAKVKAGLGSASRPDRDGESEGCR